MAGRGIHPFAGKGAEKTAGQLDNIPPEVEAEGNERPQMEGHIESESRFGPVEEPRDQDQVGGAADGKDLGQPLERAEYGSMGKVHGYSLRFIDSARAR